MMSTEIKMLTPDMHLKRIKCKIHGSIINDAMIFTEYSESNQVYYIFQNDINGGIPNDKKAFKKYKFKYSFWVGDGSSEYICSNVVNSIQFIEEPKKTFPRKMLVWDIEEKFAEERLVADIIDSRFTRNVICVRKEDEDDFIYVPEKGFIPVWFKNAKELPEIPKLTLEQVKDKLGFDFELIE